MIEKQSYAVVSLPKGGIDGKAFVQAVGRRAFAVTYDLNCMNTVITLFGSDHAMVAAALESSVSGLGLSAEEDPYFPQGSARMISFYRDAEDERLFFSDILSQPFGSGELCLLFVPGTDRENESAKGYLERKLDAKLMKETSTVRAQGYMNAINKSLHRDAHEGLEDYALMRQMLDHINNAAYTNGITYKVFAFVETAATWLEEYLANRTVILSAKSVRLNGLNEMVAEAEKAKAIPLGFRYASRLVEFYGAQHTDIPIPGPRSFFGEGIEVGSIAGYGSAKEPKVSVSRSSFNLGFLLSGLPGSGKTAEAMAVLDGIIKTGVPVFVLAPTEEWNAFAESHGIPAISPFRDGNKINFFRCEQGSSKSRFYQDLAMVLSSAADAGPYRRPMEKCMLNAFKSLAGAADPDPSNVYNRLEDSIIKFHGKRSSTGAKYTKHGENIKSALEGLRIILGDSRYSSRSGVTFGELARTGAVFDMSAASSSAKSFIYALVLNQIYGIAGEMDINGDNELRMVVCIEEAQIMFKDEDSPAVMDMKQRIQDFRKRGIGIMFLTHNINDIETGIRRLCQIKLYLRQAPDIANLAAKDLFFTAAEDEDVTAKLKSLDSRVGAFSAVVREGDAVRQRETLFIRTKEHKKEARCGVKEKEYVESDILDTAITLILGDPKRAKEDYSLRVTYLADVIEEIPCGAATHVAMLIGREYVFQITNAKGRVYWENRSAPSPRMDFIIHADGSVMLHAKG